MRRTGKNVVLSPAQFVGQQILLLHPALFPIWLAGLASFLFGRASRLRILGWTYVLLLSMMIVLKAKNYYLSPIYPMLLASGAVAVEGWLTRRAWSRERLWPKAALAAYVLAAGAIMVPAILPILPPEKLLAYQRRLHLAPPKTEVRHDGPLEQRLGDQFGWEELVADVARIYQSLPPEERAKTGIFASNYGEAGALNLFGPALGLPAPICAHQNHYFWGPPKPEPENLIWLQWGRQGVEDHCLCGREGRRAFPPVGDGRGEPRDLPVPRPPPHARGVLDPRLQALELAGPARPAPNVSSGWISRKGPSVSTTNAPPNVTSIPCVTGDFAQTSCARVPGSTSRRR